MFFLCYVYALVGCVMLEQGDYEEIFAEVRTILLERQMLRRCIFCDSGDKEIPTIWNLFHYNLGVIEFQLF